MASGAMAATLVWANWPVRPLPAGLQADRVLVLKAERRLTLLKDSQPIATYWISLGGEPRGAKQQEGDRRTPEGVYVIDYHKPDSSFFRALHVSYPNERDVASARARGVSAGGLIMIHGLPRALSFVGRLHRLADWTNGCVALTNAEMAQVYEAVPDGTPIELRP